MKKLSILIPAYNEEGTVIQLLKELNNLKLEFSLEKEIVVIDDCSTDNTSILINDFVTSNPHLTVRVFKQHLNQGKGAAIHKGITLATGEYIIIQDADLEYDPREYNHLLRPLIESKADVVYGSRFMGGNPHRILFFWHSIGNKFLTFLSNAFTNLNLTDMETGYKVFRSDIIKNIDLKEKRFGFEPEVTAKICRIPGIRIFEVGISYYGRTYANGKKINWKDGIKAIYCVFKYNFFRG